jgi:hypothetical protein
MLTSDFPLRLGEQVPHDLSQLSRGLHQFNAAAGAAQKIGEVSRFRVPGVDHADGLIPELGRALGEMAHFNDCEKILLENVQPEKLSTPLKKALLRE